MLMDSKENMKFSSFPSEKEILGFCLKKGLLIDKETLSLFSGTTDVESAKLIIEKIKEHTDSRIITKSIFYQYKDKVDEFLSGFPDEKREGIKKLKIELGLSIEILSEERRLAKNKINPEGFSIDASPKKELEKQEEKEESFVKIVSTHHPIGKKFEVGDFIKYYRNRFSEMRGILQERPELTNLVSINKISGSKQAMSIIGMVSDKKVTKNKNLILEVEDSTGKIKVIVGSNKRETFERAENICLDSVLGFKGSGSREVFFANEIFFPDVPLFDKKFAPVEEYALFISDIHVGSKLFLENNFLNFT